MRLSRWLVPAGVAAVLAGSAAVGPMLQAGAAPELPARSAAQLLTDLAQVDVPGLSGTVTERASLGLPAIPGAGDAGPASLSGLVSGTHLIRVWSAGPGHTRVGVLGGLAETEVVHNGRHVWVYDSTRNRVVHVVLPARHASPPELASTPQAAAAMVLRAVDPSTRVSVGRSAEVAGRSAYELQLRPRSDGSLVRAVTVAVDAKTGLPLRVRVIPIGQTTPAFEVGFTRLTLKVPAASTFQFTPPTSAQVHTVSPAARSDTDWKTAQHPRPVLLGRGWTTVALVRGVDLRGSDPDQRRLLDRATKPVTGPFGSGRLLRTALLTALLTDDGRLYVGAVTPAVLTATATAHR